MSLLVYRNAGRALLWVGAVGILTSCSSMRDGDSQLRRVACVGDSITYGYGIKDREQASYPARLGVMLGDRWEVRNFGVNGATALEKGTRPYSAQTAYRDALAFNPHVVIIKLGTNDTNAKSWPTHKDDFVSDYLQLIRAFQGLETRPRIYLCRPVPLFRDRGKPYDTDKILTEEVIPKINEIARQTRLPVVDFYAVFEDKPEMFPDGVHPDANGTRIMAQTLHTQLVRSKNKK